MAIAIAGMHRSGTSMVAQFLHRCGVFLGPDAILMEAAEQNPEGFWEHVQVVEINDELLSLLGGGWDYPPSGPVDWSQARFDVLRTRAERVFTEFRDHPRWGWKDPRTSLTLPFWRTVVDDLRVVAVVRNPLEVAVSLRHRNGASLAFGLALWQATYRQLLADTSPEERILTHYDAYFGRPAAEFERVLRWLGLPEDQPVVAELARAARTTRLRHHRFTARDLIEADVSDQVLDFYRTLCAEAGWTDDGFTEAADETEDEAARTAIVPHDAAYPVPWDYYAGTSLVPGLGQANRAIVELARARWDLGEHRRSAINRQARLDELEGAVAEREQKVLQRDAHISHLVAALRQRDAIIAQLNQEGSDAPAEAAGVTQVRPESSSAE